MTPEAHAEVRCAHLSRTHSVWWFNPWNCQSYLIERNLTESQAATLTAAIEHCDTREEADAIAATLEAANYDA